MQESNPNTAELLHRALLALPRPVAMNPYGDEGLILMRLEEALKRGTVGVLAPPFQTVSRLPVDEQGEAAAIIQQMLAGVIPMRATLPYSDILRRVEMVKYRLGHAARETGVDYRNLSQRLEAAVLSRGLITLFRGDATWKLLRQYDLLWIIGPFLVENGIEAQVATAPHAGGA